MIQDSHPGAEPRRALFVSSVLGSSLELVNGAIERFERQFGALAMVTEALEFHWTEYYRGELGDRPTRRFVALEEPGDPMGLPRMKRAAGRLEVALSRPGCPRQVNIDPGYLDDRQLVLASTKPRGHRIYIGEGIFADLMLIHEEGGFAALPWTYPDYAAAETRSLFSRWRDFYLSSLRRGGQS